MMSQLDLRTEGANLLRFREVPLPLAHLVRVCVCHHCAAHRLTQRVCGDSKNFRKDKSVRFPHVYVALPDVLVMSYEDGVHLTEVLRDPNFPQRKKLAAVGMRMFLQMVRICNV